MPITLDEFVRSVSDSGLMDTEEIQSFLDTLPFEQRPKTAEELADELHRLGKLTKFQAEAIYQKKTRGLVVGNYVVLDKLGEGGMGAVYKARHRRMDRIVALKVLPSTATESQEAVERFQRETKAAAKLSHPNIVTAHDADEAKGIHFLVMEYVEGQDLHALVKETGALSVPRAVDYVIQAARGLEYAHSQGVIHRDIKPGNLILDKKGTVKILDMGLARIEEVAGSNDAKANAGLTQSGQVMGTLDYMPPEQALDTRMVDVRADIYSLGCTFHYLLIGRPPYPGNSVGNKIVAHRENPIPSLRVIRSDVPESLDFVFQKMLAKRPEDRQQSMTEVISQLQGCTLKGGDAPSFPPSSSPYSETATFVQEDTGPSAESLLPQSELLASEPVPITERPVASSLCTGKRWKSRRNVVIAAVAGGLAAVLLLFGIILKVKTSEGTLVVEISEPDATIQVLDEQGKIIIERKAQKETLTIGVDPGKRRLRVEKDGFEIFAKEFAIASGGREIITAKLIPASDRPAEPSRAVVPGSETPPPLAIAPFDATKAKEHQEAWAKHFSVPVEQTNSIGMKLILIPPGEFMMGSTPEQLAWAVEEGKNNEADQYYSFNVSYEVPRHPVEITNPFYLAVYEVTQSEYRQLVGSNPSQYKGDVRQPVETVSWFDAVAFCNRLSERERLQPYYKVEGESVSIAGGNGYRLPTEAEWEYACRAGTTTKWSFGDDKSMLGDYAWHQGNSGGKPHIAGEKKPNQWGLCDMHGNLWEWCWDAGIVKYEAKSVKDPMGRSEGRGRVLRGGEFRNGLWVHRSAYRHQNPTGPRVSGNGFRLARTYSSQQPDAKLPASSTTPSSPVSSSKPVKPNRAVVPGSKTPPLAVAPFDAKKAKQHQEAWAKHLGVQVETTNSIGMKLVLIPPGEFMMGSPQEEVDLLLKEATEKNCDQWYKDQLPGEGPQHRVRITKPFYLGVTEVTQEEYQRVVGINPSEFSATGKEKDKVVGQDTKRFPVEMVSGDESKVFCEKLTAMSQEQTARRVYGLPTEAQWEYACRAGTTTKWFCGDEERGTGEFAWHATNSGRRTHTAGSRKASGFGLFDMHGNVFEWCQDGLEDYYVKSPTDDPVGPLGASYRVSRGGSWYSDARYCRSAFRFPRTPGYRYRDLGFRVASVSVDAAK